MIPLEIGADIRGLRKALERIADAQERIAAAFERPAAGADVCTHPSEARTDESTMGRPGRFYCDPARGGCGHRNFQE